MSRVRWVFFAAWLAVVLGRGGRRLDGMLVTMERRDDMRAADSDRAAVAERLRAALSEGRLELGEYDERLQRVYLAKTYADLDALLIDLPATVPADQARLAPIVGGTMVAPLPGADGRYAGATRQWLVETWGTYFSTVAMVIGIWAVICLMSQRLLYFWPGWVAGPWGAVLLVSTVTGLLSGEPQRWAGKRAARRARREQARFERRESRRTEPDGNPRD